MDTDADPQSRNRSKLATCGDHGLKFDPVKSQGCVLCKKTIIKAEKKNKKDTGFLDWVGVVLGIVLALGFLYAISSRGIIDFVIPLIAGLLMIAISQFCLLILAFETSRLWGLIVLAVPAVSVTFGFVVGGKATKYSIIYLVGLALALVVVAGNARNADDTRGIQSTDPDNQYAQSVD